MAKYSSSICYKVADELSKYCTGKADAEDLLKFCNDHVSTTAVWKRIPMSVWISIPVRITSLVWIIALVANGLQVIREKKLLGALYIIIGIIFLSEWWNSVVKFLGAL